MVPSQDKNGIPLSSQCNPVPENAKTLPHSGVYSSSRSHLARPPHQWYS